MVKLALFLTFVCATAGAVLSRDEANLPLQSFNELGGRLVRPPLAEVDRQPSVFSEPQRLIAIGDVHGDFEALVKILKGMHLVDSDLNWVGGDTFLVQLGDFFSKGPNSRQCMDLLMKLQQQAEFSGGKVIVLLGNHEAFILKRDFRFVSSRDADQFIGLLGPGEGSHDDQVKEALNFMASDQSPYGQWLASLPGMVKVGRRLFAHAGIESWIMSVSIEKVNSLVRAWMRFYQNPQQNPRPSGDTEWIVGSRGPIMARRLANQKFAPQVFDRWLRWIGVDSVVVGHSNVRDLSTVANHPSYGERLMMLDTGISRTVGGQLVAVEFRKGNGAKVHFFSRPVLFCSRVFL